MSQQAKQYALNIMTLLRKAFDGVGTDEVLAKQTIFKIKDKQTLDFINSLIAKQITPKYPKIKNLKDWINNEMSDIDRNSYKSLWDHLGKLGYKGYNKNDFLAATGKGDVVGAIGAGVGAVAAVRDQPGFAIATDLSGDDAELQLAAVVVVLALDRLHRDHDAGQSSVGVHRLETRGQPGLRPQAKAAVDVVAVILDQPLAQVAGGEGLAGAVDAVDRDGFVDGVGGQRHHRTQRLGIRRGVVERDRAAVAMADQHAVGDGERLEQVRQHVVGLDLHVADARIGRPRARAAISRAVVDDAVTARGVAQLLREIPPHLDAAQPLVQEDERRALETVAVTRGQAADAQAPVTEVDEAVGREVVEGEAVGGRHASDVAGTRRPEKVLPIGIQGNRVNA